MLVASRSTMFSGEDQQKIDPVSPAVHASMQVDGAAFVPNYFKDSASGLTTAYEKCYSIWCKKNQSSRKGVVLTLGSIPMNADFSFKLGTGSNTMLGSGTYVVMEAYSKSYYITKNNTWNDTNWHCFHININSASQLDLYKDGVLFANGGSTLQLQSNVASFNLKVGGSDNWSGQRNFAGLCARVAIWNRALTAAEIAEDYAMKNNGAVASADLIRFYGGNTTSNGALYNYIKPNDRHLLVPYGNSTVSQTTIS